MKIIYQTTGKISLFFYLFTFYQIWHLCQYGGVRNHLSMLLFGTLGFLISFILWLISKKAKGKDSSENKLKKKVFWIEIIVILIGTIYFGSRIIYSAIPYNGVLSWKINEWTKEKEIKLEHNNFSNIVWKVF